MKNALVYGGTTYDNDALRSVEMNVDTSLSERSLDVDTIHAVVDTRAAVTPGGFLTSEEYQFVTHDGYDFWCNIGTVSPAGLPQNEPVRFLRGGSQYSLWFRDSVKRIGPTLYEMVMTSSLGRLAQMPHKGGIYTGELAEDVIDDICGVVPHSVAPAFANVALYGWLPYVSPSGEDDVMQGSAKDNLMQVLFALNATVRDDANGVLVIDNLSTAVSSVITEDKIYRGSASVEYEAPITEVTVLEHQYVQGTESRVLFDGTASNGQVIVFYEPMSGLQATGFTILESGDNYCVLSAGTGELTGIPYMHTTREITRTVSTAPVPNAARVEDATLVSITNSADVADRLADYYAHRTRITADAIVEFEDAGDVISIYDPFDKVQRDACIESIYGLRASNVMRGSINALVGFTPWQVEPFVDRVVVLTGSGTWTPPAGVNRVEAVLIGGGDGGSAGSPGEVPEVPSTTTQTETYTDYVYMYWGKPNGGYSPAQGGAPGTPGSGGNILRISMELDGSGIAYSSGVGGAGEEYGEEGAAAQSGTATTFGSYSSASGSPSATGYTDPVSGVNYASSGDAGYKGGNGGGYAQVDSVWQDIPAEGVATWTGGAKNSNYREDDAGSTDSGRGHFEAYIYGGYGGGAAYGANGSDGLYDGTITWNNNPVTYGRLRMSTGGNGASATAPAKASYGKGGQGGNGGGAAGQWAHPAYIYNARKKTLTAPSTSIVQANATPTAGAGSDGGEAGNGCIILYYREPVTP